MDRVLIASGIYRVNYQWVIILRRIALLEEALHSITHK